jgi:hypothetical protein
MILRRSPFYSSFCRSVVIECWRIQFLLPRSSLFCNHLKPIAQIWELKNLPHMSNTNFAIGKDRNFSSWSHSRVLDQDVKTWNFTFCSTFRFLILRTTPIISYLIVTDFHSRYTQIDLFLCRRLNPRLISSTSQPLFRNRIAPLEEAAFSSLSGAGNMFPYDSKFAALDGRPH